MEIRNIAVVILLNERNEVLLQKKDLGFWYYPGYWAFLVEKSKKEKSLNKL